MWMEKKELIHLVSILNLIVPNTRKIRKEREEKVSPFLFHPPILHFFFRYHSMACIHCIYPSQIWNTAYSLSFDDGTLCYSGWIHVRSAGIREWEAGYPLLPSLLSLFNLLFQLVAETVHDMNMVISDFVDFVVNVTFTQTNETERTEILARASKVNWELESNTLIKSL